MFEGQFVCPMCKDNKHLKCITLNPSCFNANWNNLCQKMSKNPSN